MSLGKNQVQKKMSENASITSRNNMTEQWKVPNNPLSSRNIEVIGFFLDKVLTLKKLASLVKQTKGPKQKHIPLMITTHLNHYKVKNVMVYLGIDINIISTPLDKLKT